MFKISESELWRIRRRVLDRDGYTCRICGEKKPSPRGLISRFVGDSPNRNLTNFVTLCRLCDNDTQGWPGPEVRVLVARRDNNGNSRK